MHNRKLDTLALGKCKTGLSSLSNGEHIHHPSGELVACSIHNMYGIEAAFMLLTVLNDTNATSVMSTSHHDKLDEFHNLGSFNVDLQCHSP
jgi:hypothetical protein